MVAVAAGQVLRRMPAVNTRVGGSDSRLFHAVGIPTVVFGPTTFNMGGAYEYALRRTACDCYGSCPGGFRPPLSRRSALRATYQVQTRPA